METFILTDAAKNQITKLLAKNKDKYAVSLSVRGGGCAGFQYEWGLVDSADNIEKGDHVQEWQDGRFVVDSVSMFYVMGTVIDWRDEVFGSKFEITNPNATSGCGCGESFSV